MLKIFVLGSAMVHPDNNYIYYFFTQALILCYNFNLFYLVSSVLKFLISLTYDEMC